MLLSLLFNIIWKILTRTKREGKEIKLFLFADDIIVYVENSKNLPKN